MTLPVAILAGGLATRMRPLTDKIPKSLLEVAGEPFINHQLRLLRCHEVEQVVLCTGFLGKMLEDYVGNGDAFGLRVAYSHDGSMPLGTGGALKKALPLLGEKFMVLYGDSYLEIDYQDVVQTFLQSEVQALMVVYHNMGKYDRSNTLYRKGRILLHSKKEPEPAMQYIDYGLGCFFYDVLRVWPEEKFDLACVYAELARSGRLCGYEAKKRFYEIGSFDGLSMLRAYLAGKFLPNR
jgi:NDP-sugar pyrophosphorylase family protein